MATSRIWIETAIPGFMFVLGGVCLGLTALGVHDVSSMTAIKDFLPYLAAGVVAISLVVGFIAHRGIQLIGRVLFPAIERLFKLEAIPTVVSSDHLRDLVDAWQ